MKNSTSTTATTKVVNGKTYKVVNKETQKELTKPTTKEIVKTTAKRNAVKKEITPKKPIKEVTPKMESAKTAKIAQSWVNFDKEKSNTIQKLRYINNGVLLGSMNISRVGKNFIEHGSELLTKSQIKALEFTNIKAFINSSVKYSGLLLFTPNDMVLICNAVIKLHDNATKIATKVAKQGGSITQK